MGQQLIGVEGVRCERGCYCAKGAANYIPGSGSLGLVTPGVKG